MMFNESAWSRRYAQRYQWAYHAYERFMGEVDQELIEDFKRSEHVTVVVYGTTQVGKTTLILDLLGVQAVGHVSDVLRGGQSLGKSSTASPVRYGKSKDDCWYIGGDSQGLDDKQAEARFGAIRRAVENGETSSTDILSVRIPQCFFAPAGADSLSLDLRLLDIPGVSARNAAERKLVEKIIQEHVATADLILLVGRADHLGFLNPAALGQALSDWMLQLNRFRVVLTYTFSPASFKEWFGNSDHDAATVRAQLYEQITTHDLRPPKGQEKDLERNVFPLELGDSLEDLRGADDEGHYYARAARVIGELRRQLLDDIQSAASPYARLQSAFQVGNFISAKVERERHSHDELEQRLQGEIAQQQAVTRQLLGYEQEMDRDRKAAEEQVRLSHVRLRAFQSRNDDEANVGRFFRASGATCSAETVTALKDTVREMAFSLKRSWTTFCREGLDHDRAGTAESSPPSLRALDPFLDKLNGYVLDSYWSSDNFRKDVSLLRGIETELLGRFSFAAWNLLETELKNQRDDMLKRARHIDVQYRAACGQTRRANRVLDELHEQMNQATEAHHAFVERMRRSIEHAQTFNHYIHEAFSVELARVRHLIKSATEPGERLINLFFLPVLLAELPKMLAGQKF